MNLMPYISTPNAAHAETVFLAAKNKKHILLKNHWELTQGGTRNGRIL